MKPTQLFTSGFSIRFPCVNHVLQILSGKATTKIVFIGGIPRVWAPAASRPPRLSSASASSCLSSASACLLVVGLWSRWSKLSRWNRYSRRLHLLHDGLCLCLHWCIGNHPTLYVSSSMILPIFPRFALCPFMVVCHDFSKVSRRFIATVARQTDVLTIYPAALLGIQLTSLLRGMTHTVTGSRIASARAQWQGIGKRTGKSS